MADIPQGLELALKLVRIAAAEAEADAPAEAQELLRVCSRLEAHHTRRAHVHTEAGSLVVWQPPTNT